MTFSSTVLPSLHYNLEEDSIALKNVPSRFLTHSKETRLKWKPTILQGKKGQNGNIDSSQPTPSHSECYSSHGLTSESDVNCNIGSWKWKSPLKEFHQTSILGKWASSHYKELVFKELSHRQFSPTTTSIPPYRMTRRIFLVFYNGDIKTAFRHN